MSENSRTLEKLALHKLMEQKSMREFMLRLLEEAGVDSNGFHPEPTAHAYNSGARRVGFWALNELKESTPSNYLLMIKENLDAT